MRARAIVAATLALATTSAVGAGSALAETGSALPPTPTFEVGVHLTNGARLAPGLFFIDPHQTADDIVTGPEIIDNRGRVVWYHPLKAGESASNFQVQELNGQPVLTWWQGTGDNPAFGAFAPGIGQGEDVVMNEHYRIIRTIPTTKDFTPDTHEFYVTPNGDALITGYATVTGVDMTSVGGTADGTVIDSLAREVDLNTGKVVFTWSALAHVPLTDSHALPLLGASPWDFFHINSISPAPDGNILIDSRHMWAMYDIDPRNGRIVWTLGGKQSSFTVATDAQFAWQHDPRFLSKNEIQLFDDEAGIPFEPNATQSRALWLHVDYQNHTVSLIKQIVQPTDQAQSGSQGSVQTLTDGHVVVGWGSAGTFGEYGANGRLLINFTPSAPIGIVTVGGKTVPNAWQTYRVFKELWTGLPLTAPSVTVTPKAAAEWTVAAAWNGATTLKRWLILAGSNRRHLHRVRSVAWNGLITSATVGGSDIRYVQVVALNGRGRVLGSSEVVAAG